jgi:serine/threonine-protein phosphatase 2B catalytic subunit
MDGDAPVVPEGTQNKAQIDNAIRALNEKKPVPEIDFTLHTMEDGTQVSTMERVCKGNHDDQILGKFQTES